jgi:hypothetical protein
MIRATLVFFALTTSVAAAAAQPITLQCKIVGTDEWGPLTVTVDEAARHVRIDAMKRPHLHNDYRDGAIGPTITVDHSSDEHDAHEQFVRRTADRIEFGWRSPADGRIGHFVWIDAGALTHEKPCLFHSTWHFARG